MAFSYSPDELAGMLQATQHGTNPHDLRILFLLTDSRKITFARSAVFFALKTPKNDGHKYIGELIQKGVGCFVVSSLPSQSQWLEKACFLLVEDTLDALQNLAAGHRARFHYPVTGITGSNGKTIVKEWLAQLLAPDLKIVKNPRSYNSQTGVPLSVWNMQNTDKLGIFEAGISKMGEMQKLERIIRPQIGIFTNIGPAHDEGFTHNEQKILEKLILFEQSQLLIYNSDQLLVDQCVRKWCKQHPDIQLFCWGTQPTDQLRILNTRANQNSYSLELEFDGLKYFFQVPFFDRASLENLMHCLAFIFANGLYHPQIPARVLKLEPLAMRMEMKQAINGCLLVNDAYSSDFLSLGIALDFLRTQAGHRQKVLILSDILQSGLSADELYTNVASLLVEKGIFKLIAIGNEVSNHQHCFNGVNAVFFPDTKSFLKEYDLDELKQMGILIKGAREFGFERISQKLQLKDHQTLLEINLDALVHNLNIYRSLLQPETKIMAMVKAFSYGSGSYEIAGLLQFHGLDYLAVAFADEGNDLRNAGITMPIVVLNPEVHNLDILFRYNLEPEIYSIGLLKRFIEASFNFPQYHADNSFPIHIKLDTGMHRLGFMEKELEELLILLKSAPAFKVASVFSHLAASDKPEFDDFSLAQISLFEQLTRHMQQELGYKFIRHIDNSAAIVRFPQAHFEMVRPGIGLYGVDGSEQLLGQLQNVTTFKSVVSQIKVLPAGESVGYNRAAMLHHATRMAIVPVGYADGLDRRLGNGNTYMLVNGQKAFTLGNISMDMCCLDITRLDVSEGDEVIIFGEQLPVQEMANKLQTIPYEVFTGIPQRVKRVYFSE